MLLGSYSSPYHYGSSNGSSTTAMNISGHCPYCSTPWTFVYHEGLCPKIKAKEFYPDGSLKRVEFHDGRMAGLHLGDAEMTVDFDRPLELT
jgi:hypothetical protein